MLTTRSRACYRNVTEVFVRFFTRHLQHKIIQLSPEFRLKKYILSFASKKLIFQLYLHSFIRDKNISKIYEKINKINDK